MDINWLERKMRNFKVFLRFSVTSGILLHVLMKGMKDNKGVKMNINNLDTSALLSTRRKMKNLHGILIFPAHLLDFKRCNSGGRRENETG